MKSVALFCDRLNEVFRKSRLSQKEVSELTGISRPLLNMYLKGKCDASVVNCVLLADVFRVSPAWLYGFDVAPDSLSDESICVKNEIINLLETMSVKQLDTLLAFIKSFIK